MSELAVQISDGFSLTIPRTQAAAEETLVKTPVKIMELLKENHGMTLAEVLAPPKAAIGKY